jgi:hypothetical protein
MEADALCRERNRTATKSNAASIWRRVFVESLLAHGNASIRHASQRKAIQRKASKSKAVSHRRRWFIEVFSLQCSAGHCTAVNCIARQSTELNFKATRPALHEGLSESFSAQCMDLQYGAAQGKAQHEKEGQIKATRQGHSMSGFVEGLSSHGMASQGTESNCTAGQPIARQ